MTDRRLLRARSRAAWRVWLARNHATAKEVWLVYRKKHTGKPRLTYPEAVEEALCFGWIDTTVNRLDEDHYMQRFTPRTNTRNWSTLNLERFERMVAQGRMTEAGRIKRPAGVRPPKKRLQSGDPVPKFIERALASHPDERKKFLALAPSYRRDYVRWITEAKRPETRERRLREALRRLRENWKRVYDPSSVPEPQPTPDEQRRSSLRPSIPGARRGRRGSDSTARG
jgi:uncharacterized protein YdeI (YjbR/CyaY-like superfamily)